MRLPCVFLFVVGGAFLAFGQETEHGEDVCANRIGEEWFRTSNQDCRTVYQCAPSGVQKMRCPSGLLFDISTQACNWPEFVSNCKELEKPEIVKPLLNTEEPMCTSASEIACGDGTCMERTLFCDGEPHCADGSDETYCGPRQDPNRAPACEDSRNCSLPHCFCSTKGTSIPNNLSAKDTPQMVLLSFSGAINNNNIDLYNKILDGSRKNPNGCTIKATFFVHHMYSNYTAVQHYHQLGHEIAISLIENVLQTYWQSASMKEWKITIRDLKKILENFAGLSSHSRLGVRTPYLKVGGNNQFSAMVEQDFLYDSTIIAALHDPPYWPYTLDHTMPHDCHGDQYCPSRSFNVWEMVMNELDRRESSYTEEALSGCTMVDSCSNIRYGSQLYSFLNRNFYRHYKTNRAPLGLPFHSAWLANNPNLLGVFLMWVSEIMHQHKDVYFVTMSQAIEWMKNPHPIRDLESFQPWGNNCNPDVPSPCKPKGCSLTTSNVPGESFRLYTCAECPNVYPWISDPTGTGRP